MLASILYSSSSLSSILITPSRREPISFEASGYIIEMIGHAVYPIKECPHCQPENLPPLEDFKAEAKRKSL